MDGNGRWANRRLLPRIAGHRAGVEAVAGRLLTDALVLALRFSHFMRSLSRIGNVRQSRSRR
jgi:undecaprenyl diphosphate synthase